jgi:hypothetical protein
LNSDKFSVPHANTRHAIKKVEDVSGRIKAFYKSMDSFSKRTSADIKSHSPQGHVPQTPHLKQASGDFRLQGRNKPRSLYSGVKLKPREAYFDQPERVLQSRRKSFRNARAAQGQNLSVILTRIKRDRPAVMKEKVKMVHIDTQTYKDSLHTISLFNDLRKNLERDRVDRRDKALDQMKGYLQLCEYMRSMESKPTEKELKLLERVKTQLEEGLGMSLLEFKAVLEELDWDDNERPETAAEFRVKLGLRHT